MLTAIASRTHPAAASAYGGGRLSPASLQAQLQRFEQQLSDCVNCASAKTPRGKADIQAIAVRISQVRERIAEADGARAAPGAGVEPARSAPSAGAPQGGIIDVFA